MAEKIINKTKILDLYDRKKTGVFGLKKYAMEYNEQFKNVEEMRKEIENAVAAYDEHLKERKEKRKQVETQEPDDEGWVTVAKGDKHAFKARPIHTKGLASIKKKKVKKNKA